MRFTCLNITEGLCLGQHECTCLGTDFPTALLICRDLYFISVLSIYKAVFGT